MKLAFWLSPSVVDPPHPFSSFCSIGIGLLNANVAVVDKKHGEASVLSWKVLAVFIRWQTVRFYDVPILTSLD
jgi:hypothetical protein